MADEQLSGQDIADLIQIRGKLPKGDPRLGKIDALINTAGPPSAANPIQQDNTGFASRLGTGLALKAGDIVGGGAQTTINALQNVPQQAQKFAQFLRDVPKVGYQAATATSPQPPQSDRELLANILGINSKNLGEAIQNKDVASGLTELAPATLAAILGARGGVRSAFIKAEGNPNTVYHSYLDPVAKTPAEMPAVTPKVLRKLASELETEDPAIAARIKSGETTIGDLDRARIAANRFAAKAYQPGSAIPPAMAEGMAQLANQLRETIYPQLEEAHGLPPGSLGTIKKLEGQLIKARGVGFQFNPYAPTQYPFAGAKYLLNKANKGYIRARVKAAAASMPSPSDTEDLNPNR